MTVRALPQTLWYSWRKYLKRRRMVALSIALIIASLSFGLTLATFSSIAANRARMQAQESLTRFRVVNQFMEDMLTAPDPYKRAIDTRVIDLLTEAERSLQEKGLQDDPALQAAIRTTIGSTYRGIGQYDKARTHLEKALELRRPLLGDRHPDTLKTAHLLARVLMNQGHFEQARDGFKDVIAGRSDVLGPQHTDTLRSRAGMASVLISLGHYGRSEQVFLEVWQKQNEMLGPRDRETLRSLQGLANALYAQGKYQEAERRYRDTYAIQEDLFGLQHPDTLTTMNNLANCLRGQGREPEAEKMYRTLLPQREAVLGKLNPYTIRTRYGLARCLHQQGKYNEAESLLEQVIREREHTEGVVHFRTLRTRNMLARVMIDAGKRDAAREQLRTIMDICRANNKLDDPQAAKAVNNLAHFFLQEGRYREAHTLLEEILVIRETAYGPLDKGNIMLNGNMVVALVGMRDAEAVLEHSRKIVAILEAYQGRPHPAESMVYADALIRLKRFDEAEQILEGLNAENQERGRQDPTVLEALKRVRQKP